MYNSKNNRLYAAFIDYQKAYDSVYRNGLWYKLIKEGISGKMLTLLRSIYEELMNALPDFFSCNMGLFQGEITSPFLFSFFLNDLETHLQSNIFSGVNLDQICIYLILFADDLILLSETPQGLQSHLDLLYDYCRRWKLTVNINKTKIIVFRKRGRLHENEQWTYSGDNIEVVDSFNYLGFTVSSNGSFKWGIETLSGKALKAMNSLQMLTKGMEIPMNIKFNLFDSYVTSILCYSCEIWGFNNAENLKRLHRKFLERTLNVKMSTCNAAVYMETGRYPLCINWKKRIVRYWLKLVKSENSILENIYMKLLIDCENGEKNWLYNIKMLLSQIGLEEVWLFPTSVNTNVFLHVLIDFITECRIRTDNSPSLTLLRE